jgi:uncharacterized protein YndB with AHSA1/START domain
MHEENSVTVTLTMPSDLEVVAECVLNAPRQLVFKAYTDKSLVPHWWGPRSLTTTVDKMDVRPGGAWRFVQHDAHGHEFAFHGEYREIVTNEKISDTFEFEAMPGHVVVETVTFQDLDGKTKVTVTSHFPSKEDRDGMLKSGMEFGMREGWERMTELLVATA